LLVFPLISGSTVFGLYVFYSSLDLSELAKAAKKKLQAVSSCHKWSVL